MPVEKTIFIIDDDPEDVMLLKESLEKEGWKGPVRSAGDAFEGLRTVTSLEKQPGGVAMIIVDINMPGMSGFDLLKAAKQQGSSSPVTIYSTVCTAVEVQKAKELGALDCVKKMTSYTEFERFAKKVIALIGSTPVPGGDQRRPRRLSAGMVDTAPQELSGSIERIAWVKIRSNRTRRR